MFPSSSDKKPDKNELKLATSLVEQMVTSLAEIDTTDNYHEALTKLIDSKIKGKKTVEFEPVEEIPRLDIMSALKKSLQQSNRKPMVKAPSVAKKKPQITWSRVKQNQRPLSDERLLSFLVADERKQP